MDHERLQFLFRRYLNGRCSAAEEAELLEYLTTNDNEDATRMLEGLWQHPGSRLSRRKSEEILNHILGKEKEVRLKTPGAQFSWRIAASIAITAAAGILFYQYASAPSQHVAEPIAASVNAHQFIKLPDGSTVLLNNGSKLDYPETFDGAAREVTLSGEAFFDIEHNADKPFVVRTGSLSTTVLGTTFNVRAYDGDDNITVTVKSGRVSVSDEKQVLGVIHRDQQISFSKVTQKAEHKEVKSEDVLAWAEKDIFFDDVTIGEAVLLLEDRFEVDITLEHPNINSCRFTATFMKGEDLFQILDVICEFNAVSYAEEASGEIRIIGTACAAEKTKMNLKPNL